MKKVQITTLHSQNNNFGSVLQGYALYKYTKNLGYDVEILNYRPYYSNGAKDIKTRIKKLIVNTLFLPHYIKRSKRFNEFLEYEKQSKVYKTYEALVENPPKADIYMIGSDQVWNKSYLCGNDLAYYLKYTNSPNKMSYAASMGRKVNNEEELKEILELTNDFKYISLREEESKLELQSVGSKNVEYVLDPVFLLNKEQYKEIQAKNNEKDYILAYIIHKDDFISKVVDEVAKKTGKKVIQVGGFSSKCNYDYFPKDAGPKEFLGLIENASFVITSSFHGLAFSHIYEKQFLVVMPHTNTLRLENILKTAGTTNRIVTNINDIEKINEVINYDEVTPRLRKKITESREYLQNSLRELSKGEVKSYGNM